MAVIDDLQSFLDELAELAPRREHSEPIRVDYRRLGDEEVIDDSLPAEDDLGSNPSDEERQETAPQDVPEPNEFIETVVGPVIGIDCGIARLGETENGSVIALRAADILVSEEASDVALYRTGPIYVRNDRKLQLLHQMGVHLGKPDLFVEMKRVGGDDVPSKVKSGIANDAHKFGDRFRNWFERLVQRIAVVKIENGIILLDGALTLRTVDTPDIFFERLANAAGDRGNALIAISKQSLLQVRDRSIRFWLDDHRGRVCYRDLTSLLRHEDTERVLGNVYAARFSAVGPTFRVDVKAAPGQSDREAMNQFFSSAIMRGGYPDILVRAHTHSYFTSPDVVQLQAQAGAQYSLVPRGEIDLSGIFGPFGGRFK
jgi:hypothetical protein